MSEVLKRAKVRHIFGGEEASGWTPPTSARPPRTPAIAVDLELAIETDGRGFVLQWTGPSTEYCGDLWYPELPYAVHAAEELFGVTSDDWDALGGSLPPEASLYRARFPVGTRVRVADRATLAHFRETWKYHNPLTDDQLAYADRQSDVQEVGFYHGGDVLYRLNGIPGVWHEVCVREM